MGFSSWGVPYQRGFFCDDESIGYPYRDSTVPGLVLYLVCLVIPIALVSVEVLGHLLSEQIQSYIHLQVYFTDLQNFKNHQKTDRRIRSNPIECCSNVIGGHVSILVCLLFNEIFITNNNDECGQIIVLMAPVRRLSGFLYRPTTTKLMFTQKKKTLYFSILLLLLKSPCGRAVGVYL